MGMTVDGGAVVLLSERERAPDLEARLAQAQGSVAWYGSLEDLVRGRAVSSIDVLVVHCGSQPSGLLLAVLGRMAVENPDMQKVVVLDVPPPLPIATYLASCGVDMVWPGSAAGKLDELGAVVERMREGRKWLVTRQRTAEGRGGRD